MTQRTKQLLDQLEMLANSQANKPCLTIPVPPYHIEGKPIQVFPGDIREVVEELRRIDKLFYCFMMGNEGSEREISKMVVEELKRQLDAANLDRDRLQAELNKANDKLKVVTERPYTLLRYVGGPFGECEVKEYRDCYWQINQTVVKEERVLYSVVAVDHSNPKQPVITLRYISNEKSNG